MSLFGKIKCSDIVSIISFEYVSSIVAQKNEVLFILERNGP